MKIKNSANSPFNLRDGNMAKVRIGARSIFEVVDNEDDADNVTRFFLNEKQVAELLRMQCFTKMKDDTEVTPVADHVETLYGSSVLPSMVELAEGNEVPLGAVVIRAHKESELSIADWNALETDDREGRLQEMVNLMKAEVEALGDQDADTSDDDDKEDADEDAGDEPQLSLSELRAKYRKVAGKKAPKSWKEDRLSKEIEALEE